MGEYEGLVGLYDGLKKHRQKGRERVSNERRKPRDYKPHISTYLVGEYDGLVGEYEGLVGLYDGLVGEYDGDVGEYEGLVGL